MASLKVVEIQGKGRALVAAKPLRGGDVVLVDHPILLYAALLPPQSLSYCAHCFAKAPPHSGHRCGRCSAVEFCSAACSAAGSHSDWVCDSLSLLRRHAHLDHDRLLQARFLIAAYNLSAPDFQALLSLQGSPDAAAAAAAAFLHSLGIFADGRAVSPEVSAALLAKERLNAFGLMEPFSAAEEGRRSVRAYGVYPKAALFNHDCLPNACRFDWPDGGRGPEMTVRMIHDVPEGREICLSYFPVNEKFGSRQRRLKEEYGFCCDCDRCKVEANWSDDDEEQADEDVNTKMDDDDQEEEDEDYEDMNMEEEESESESSFPHAYFFARYMCDRSNCWGTLAPLPPHQQQHSKDNIVVMECNVCANLTFVPQH